jgi:hypothetical protein
MAENMTDNAKYIYSFFRGKGWTSNSICGMLGNMQAESGIIANKDEIGGGGGYGLVQWTPKSTLTNWAAANGLDPTTVDTQCRRIQWELENYQQFYSTSAYPLTFQEFTQSTDTPTYLAAVFIHNYERPANPDQPQRGVYAEQWYSILVNGTTPPSDVYQVSAYPYSPNATAETNFDVRNSDGTVVSGHVVTTGDKLCILSVNYDLQLAEVVYPITNGYMHGWITNLQSEISDTYHFKWRNGSTNETVYSSSTGTTVSGTIYPNEYATPLYQKDGRYALLYNTSKGDETKFGFVNYHDGFSF